MNSKITDEKQTILSVIYAALMAVLIVVYYIFIPLYYQNFKGYESYFLWCMSIMIITWAVFILFHCLNRLVHDYLKDPVVLRICQALCFQASFAIYFGVLVYTALHMSTDSHLMACYNGTSKCIPQCLIDNKLSKHCAYFINNYKDKLTDDDLNTFCEKYPHDLKLADMCFEVYQRKHQFKFAGGVNSDNICLISKPNKIQCLGKTSPFTPQDEEKVKSIPNLKSLYLTDNSYIAIDENDTINSNVHGKYYYEHEKFIDFIKDGIKEGQITPKRFCILNTKSELMCSGYKITLDLLKAGGRHNCLITPNTRQVRCWGNYANGVLEVPEDFQKDTRVLSTGYGHTCGVDNEGELLCWGLNQDGQLDKPDGFRYGTKTVAAGFQHSCAVDAHKELKCWGKLADSQVLVPAELKDNVEQVSTRGGHTCVIDGAGKVQCWGLNEDGQADVPAGLEQKSTGLSTGTRHSCAVGDGNQLQCWGDNTHQQTEVPAAFLENTLLVAAGGGHTCGMQLNGGVACWGFNNKMQTEVPAAFKQGALGLATSFENTCGIERSGRLSCWGDNEMGQSNVPDTAQFPAPLLATEVQSFSVLNHDICYHSLNHKNFLPQCYDEMEYVQKLRYSDVSGNRYCLTGNNYFCYVSLDNTNAFLCADMRFPEEPLERILDKEVDEISCGYEHACATWIDGRAFCFKLSKNNEYKESVLTEEMQTGVVSIKAGKNSTCVFKKNLKILCNGKDMKQSSRIYNYGLPLQRKNKE